MSDTSAADSAGLVDETGRKMSSNDTVEPLLRYVQEHPVCTVLAAQQFYRLVFDGVLVAQPDDVDISGVVSHAGLHCLGR